MSSENLSGQPQDDGRSDQHDAAPEDPATHVPAPPMPPISDAQPQYQDAPQAEFAPNAVAPADAALQSASPEAQAPRAAAPQGAYSVPPGGPGGPEGPGGSPARKGFPAWVWWVIGGGGVLVAAIVVAVVLVFANLGSGGPQGVAEGYVNSLNDGDTDRANELARVVDTDKRLVVLTSEAFAEAEGATDFKIERFQHHEDRAMAEVSYLVDGSKLSDYVEITRDGDGWYVSTGLTYRLPSVYTGGVEGYRVPGFEGVIDSDLELQAYPGVYTMLPPSDYFELASDTSFEVGVSRSYSAPQPEFVPTKKYLDEVNEAIVSHIEACLDELGDGDIYSLSRCGISANPTETYGVTSFEVQVTEYPTAGVDPNYGSIVIENVGAVTVQVTGSQIGGGEGTESIAGEFSRLYLDATVSDDTVEVEFY